MTRMDILVLCLGNALRRDDAVALHVADALERCDALERTGPASPSGAAPPPGSTCSTTWRGSTAWWWSTRSGPGAHPPGTVLAFPLDALHAPEGPSPHAIGMPSALARAAAAGAPVPTRIEVVAIEAEELDRVGEGLTPAVAAAVPEAVAAVRRAVAALVRP